MGYDAGKLPKRYQVSRSKTVKANIPVQSIDQSRIDKVDFDNLGFGDCFSDHIFAMDFYAGAWRDPRIEPYGPLILEPGTASLHYGQLVFEGLKAFRGEDGQVRLFRPDANAERLYHSCQRLCIPPVEQDLFCSAVETLVAVDRQWIPSRPGQALYIRPLIVGTEAHLDVRPSQTYRLLIMTSPVREYFAGGFAPIALKVEERYTRAAPGGMGFAKTAGNYAASLRPTAEAQAAGYNQVLWLDGREHRHIEEVGQMNIFFHLGDTVVTAPLSGTILPGVTRDAVITLLREWGVAVEERPVTIEEILEASLSGQLHEAFGSGTAAVVAPIGRLGYRGEDHAVPAAMEHGLARRLYDEILGIQYGRLADRHGWTCIVP